MVRGYALAWVAYVVAAGIISRSARPPRGALVWIVVVAIGLRLVCLARTPALSTDMWRYLWDGRVANAGINPYRYAPDAPQLRHLRDDNWQSINFKPISTIYPPAAQVMFMALARVREADAEAFRWTFALFDIGSIALLICLLRRTGRPPERVVWYAWCPLAVTEVTAGAHVDAAGLFLLLLAFALAARSGGRPGPASAAALAGAVMTKGYAVLAAPFLLRRGGWRALPWLTLPCLLLIAPYLGVGGQLFGGLHAYVARWKVNSSVFFLLDRMLEAVTPLHFEITRAVTIALVIAVTAWLVWRQGSGVEGLIKASFAAIFAQLLLGAPTLPWYVVWVAPALCWWTIPSGVLFTFTVSAQYYARWLYPGDPAAHDRLLLAGYLPVYALLLGQLILWRLRLRRSGPSRIP